jgi:DNA-binding MarR family transcriptional regulator
MSREVELLAEIRDLLQVMAEPALAKRDEKFRSAIRSVVGKSQKSASAVVLMDGSRAQAAISKEVGIDPSQLNRLIKSLEKHALVGADEKHPKLRVKLPPNFFDEHGKTHE